MDTDLHVGNEPCQTVKPVVVDAARKEVTTGLNFLVSRQASKLSFTTAGRRQKGSNKAASDSHKNACHPASFFLLMWDMIATIETSAKHNDQLLLPQQQYP